MGKKFSGISQKLTRFRKYIQAAAALLSNLHLPNFLKGEIIGEPEKQYVCRDLTATHVLRHPEPALSVRFKR